MEQSTSGPVAQLIMFNYPEHIKLSSKRRPTYWHPDDELPKYLQDTLIYRFKGVKMKDSSEMRLFNIQQNTAVLRNHKVVDKPRMQKINFNNMWAGMNEFVRVKLRDQLHAFYEPHLVNVKERYAPLLVPPKNHYLHIEYIFYFPFQRREPNQWADYFNHMAPYVKTFEDSLTNTGLICNDSPTVLRGAYMRYVAIPEEGDRRMVVQFYHRVNNDSI